MYFKNKNLLFVLSLLFMGYTNAQKGSEVEKSFSKIKWKEGSRSYEVKNKFGKKWKLMAYFPNTEENPKTPLVIALHWAGIGETYREFHDCLAVPGTKKLKAIVISPEGEGQLWDTANNIQKIADIIGFAKANWSIDHDKILITGYSNGGNGSWYHAEHNPDWFKAVIPMAGAYAPKKKIKTPVYAIHGAKDELFPVERTKAWVKNSKEKGSDITMVINQKLSHFEACNYTTELEKAVDWVLEKVFN